MGRWERGCHLSQRIPHLALQLGVGLGGKSQRANEHITKRIYIGPLGKLKLFQRTEIMQGILRDCNGLTVYGPSNFTRQVVMILGGRHSGRGQARGEWAPVLREQGEEAGSLGTRKQASPDEAPAGEDFEDASNLKSGTFWLSLGHLSRPCILVP